MDSSSIKWYVSYKVPAVSGDKVHIAGPYPTATVAEQNALDIGEFEGVTGLDIYKENANELLDTQIVN